MSTIQKLIEKIHKIPTPNDISYDELKRLAQHFGCQVIPGGKHPIKIYHLETGTIIVVPRHGKTVKEAYIEQAKELFDEISDNKEK